ncbi:MAG: SAF domain-containing protein [Nocardioides sp.]
MTTDSSTSLADQQRSRAFRGLAANGRAPGGSARPVVKPPRQRRPALAALAVLLVVGGALIAGLLAVRMDSRTSVLVAAREIVPGSRITAEDLRAVSVSASGLSLISADDAAQLADGSWYAAQDIRPGTLLDRNLVNPTAPSGDDKVMVSMSLSAALAPSSTLRGGDLIEVVRTAGDKSSSAAAAPQVISQALVMGISTGASDSLSSGSTTAVLLVPRSVAPQIIDASAAGQAGAALLKRGQPTTVKLEVAE